jgi:hypothetical protein
MAQPESNPFWGLEHRKQPLLGRGAFLRRWIVFVLIALSLITVSLAIGMVGYHFLEKMSWLDAYLNASMLLGGMGPVGELHYPAGKIFAGLYAMFSGLVLLVSVGVMLTPLFHRFLHKFHVDLEGDS